MKTAVFLFVLLAVVSEKLFTAEVIQHDVCAI